MMTTALQPFAIAALLSCNAALGGGGGTSETPFVSAAGTPPPGIVPLEGGRVKVGSTTKDIEKILEMSKAHHGQVRLLDGETPQYDQTLAPFGIGKYEVTNEQFLAFVQGTARRPPEHWLSEAVAKAQNAFLVAEGEKANEARAKGEKYEMKTWTEQVKEAWLDKNWQSAEWGVPAGDEAKPVGYVDYEDVVEYCEWAGLRLPTEAEWISAGRGGSDDWFTWGNEWSATARAHTLEVQRPQLLPVGSMAGGVTKAGVHDLGGSVWEWTSSPYNAFPRFRANAYKGKVGKDRFEIQPPVSDFRSSHKVIKGGSFSVPLVAARLAFRQGTMRTQTASELGFRAASSLVPGSDIAGAAWTNTLQRCPARKDEATLDYINVTGADRWSTKLTPEGRPDGYAIINGYEAIAFVPRGNLEIKGDELKIASRVWPVTIGAFVTTRKIVEPALEPGSYLVLFRAKGKFGQTTDEEVPVGEVKEGEGEAPAADDPAALAAQSVLANVDTKKHILIFCHGETGEVVATIEIDDFSKKDDRFQNVENQLTFDSREIVVGTGVERRKETQDWLRFEGKIPFAGGKRALPVPFALRLEAGTFGSGWRN